MLNGNFYNIQFEFEITITQHNYIKLVFYHFKNYLVIYISTKVNTKCYK